MRSLGIFCWHPIPRSAQCATRSSDRIDLRTGSITVYVEAMFVDAGELWEFYSAPLGHTVRRVIGTRVRSRWRHIEGETLMGLGYASPFLGSFRGEASRIGALMPAAQGAVVWPTAGDSMTVLAAEDELPLPDNSVDKLLVAHCLEFSERVQPLLREIWRILAPEGRALFIVPNRRGVWARMDTTPFGQGRPFSRRQLDRLLGQALLTPVDCWWALHWPPVDRPVVLKSAVAIERLGSRLWPAFGGVILYEARKELAAPTGKLARVRSVGELVTVPSPASPAHRRPIIFPSAGRPPSRRTRSADAETG